MARKAHDYVVSRTLPVLTLGATTISERRETQPTILSYVGDLPNLCSLGGLACTILAIHFSIQGVYEAAMIGMVWAVASDWGSFAQPLALRGQAELACSRVLPGARELSTNPAPTLRVV
jgi:hypothetical protein